MLRSGLILKRRLVERQWCVDAVRELVFAEAEFVSADVAAQGLVERVDRGRGVAALATCLTGSSPLDLMRWDTATAPSKP
jgi:hypothetical protein